MIDIASNQQKILSPVPFQVGLVYDFTSKDNSFDVIYDLQVTIHLCDPVKGLEEMLRKCET